MEWTVVVRRRVLGGLSLSHAEGETACGRVQTHGAARQKRRVGPNTALWVARRTSAHARVSSYVYTTHSAKTKADGAAVRPEPRRNTA